MSNFPTSFDDDTTLPAVNSNLTEIGDEAINAVRDAVFNIEQYLGLTANGTTASASVRLDVSLFPDGTIRPSALTSLGLITLPITDDQISDTAQIIESKLKLDHRTQDLYNYITDLSSGVKRAIGWISISGIKLEPHLNGSIYRHVLNQIDVSGDSTQFLKNKFEVIRNNSDSFQLINDINNEFLYHQFTDGSGVSAQNVITHDGSSYPSVYGHTASGIFLDTARFNIVPQTAFDMQSFAEFVDSSSIFLYGTRIQNLYSNGISKVSRSSSLSIDGYGLLVIPPTPAIAHLLNNGTSSSPVDDIDNGDDIIELKPLTADTANNSFDEKFALVRVGDVFRINYGNIETQYLIKEKKYIQGGGVKKYIVRITGKNLQYSANASVRIDRSLVNDNKFGVLAVAPVNNAFSVLPSLIVGSPRSAMSLGVGFNADQLDSTHYLLYLALYPTGSPQDGYISLPPVDITGNRGITPGQYTLDSVVQTTNNAFRQAGFNYRFIAFAYKGEFGIMLADSYNNTGFSIFNAVVDDNGMFDQSATENSFSNNVVGIFPPDDNSTAPDPLGFGPLNANIASPAYLSSYASPEAALNPTKLFLPLKRNNYYVNGIERDTLSLEVNQVLDGYGDGYWIANVQNQNVFPGSPGRVETTYRIPLDLSNSQLKIGKTLVVQSVGIGDIVNFGRFIISNITHSCSPNDYTDITVYDAVHATGVSPKPVISIGSQVGIYFGFDSVGFNTESATDFNQVSPFKRHFELFIDQNGKTFTHERGRINISNSSIVINGTVPLLTYSELNKLNIIRISPKLKGYQFGSVNKISLHMLNFDSVSGNYDGYLASFDGIAFTKSGSVVSGKKGEITRFYDETNVDYIDILFDLNVATNSFVDQVIDFQLFPTLSLNDEIMLLSTCQVNDITNLIDQLRDERQFGNTSEKDFSTSALNFISLPERLLHGNGVLRGFDLESSSTNPNGQQIYLTGGLVLVNGKFIEMNNETITIPYVKEFNSILYNVNWALCINEGGEYQTIPLLDFDPRLNTLANPERIFRAYNLIDANYYFLDALTFSDIINKRKDLTILYVVGSQTTTTPSITLTTYDSRKFINDVDSNIPLKLTTSKAQGNFRNPAAIFSWIKYNGNFNGQISVKGADSTSGIVADDFTLDFNSNVVIDGENDATITMNGNVILGSNLTFRNLDIIFNGNISILPLANNLSFENCTITVNGSTINSPTDNALFSFSGSNNVIIKDCNFEIVNFKIITTLTSSEAAVFKLLNTTNFKFINSSLSVAFIQDFNFNLSDGYLSGDVFALVDSPGVVIETFNIFGNFNQCIRNTRSNSMLVDTGIITSTYNPLSNVGHPDVYPSHANEQLPSVSYNSSNFVNTGRGYIYANILTSLDNININNVVFNYSPSFTTDISPNDRFSFINFELSPQNTFVASNADVNIAKLMNTNITNCKFNSTVAVGSSEDFRAAISIINKSAGTFANSQMASLLNVNISNNKCNRNQSIILTSILDDEGNMSSPGLAAQNVIVKNNTCGTIGYFVATGNEYSQFNNSTQINVNQFSDVPNGLIIEGNSCKYIANIDATGFYFLLSQATGSTSSPTFSNLVSYPTGNVSINNNKTCWIHVGIAFEENSSLNITNNSLKAYEQNFITQFGDDSRFRLGGKNIALFSYNFFLQYGFAIVVAGLQPVANVLSDPGNGNNSSVIISNNTTSTGYWTQSGSLITYKYPFGYIATSSSANITNNILKGTNNDNSFQGTCSLITVGGLNNIISNNKIYRQGKTISFHANDGNDAYIRYFDFNPNVSVANSGIITDNFLDGYVINDSDPTSINVISTTDRNGGSWIVERNKNQTVSKILNAGTYGKIVDGYPPVDGDPNAHINGRTNYIGTTGDSNANIKSIRFNRNNFTNDISHSPDYLQYSVQVAASTRTIVSWIIPIAEIIPNTASFISAQTSWLTNGVFADFGSSQVFIKIKNQISANNTDQDFASSNIGVLNTDQNGNLLINQVIPGSFINNTNAYLTVDLVASSLTADHTVGFTALLLQYRW